MVLLKKKKKRGKEEISCGVIWTSPMELYEIPLNVFPSRRTRTFSAGFWRETASSQPAVTRRGCRRPRTTRPPETHSPSAASLASFLAWTTLGSTRALKNERDLRCQPQKGSIDDSFLFFNSLALVENFFVFQRHAA